MARKVIPMVTGEIYHVYNRGADKREIFKDKDDVLRFYRSMLLFNSKEPATNFSFANAHVDEIKNSIPLVEVHAYSLIDNHFHMLLKQVSDDGVSEYMKRLTGGYTSYFNEKYKRSGVLFQGRYKKIHVSSEEQYQYLFAYVNENHFVHNLPRPHEIMYSSSMHFEGVFNSAIISFKREYEAHTERKLAREIFERRRHGVNESLE